MPKVPRKTRLPRDTFTTPPVDPLSGVHKGKPKKAETMTNPEDFGKETMWFFPPEDNPTRSPHPPYAQKIKSTKPSAKSKSRR